MQRPAYIDKAGSSSSCSSTDPDAAGISFKREKHPGPADHPRAPSYSAHPTTGAASLTGGESLTVQPLKGQFSMRGELMHAFICYRLATEGPMGNGRPPAPCFL